MVESYTVLPAGEGMHSIIVGRLDATNERFLAVADSEHAPTARLLASADLLGLRGEVETLEAGNRFRFAAN